MTVLPRSSRRSLLMAAAYLGLFATTTRSSRTGTNVLVTAAAIPTSYSSSHVAKTSSPPANHHHRHRHHEHHGDHDGSHDTFPRSSSSLLEETDASPLVTSSFAKSSRDSMMIATTVGTSQPKNDARHNHQKFHFLNGVALLAATNIVFNWLRPDPGLLWQFRFPRIVWEGCILLTVTFTSSHDRFGVSSLQYLLLAIMLGCTSLMDIFVWAPLFALWAGIDGQDCSGGWFTGRPYVCQPNYWKGYGRLVVTLQSLLGGVLYMASALAAWNEYANHREERQARRQERLWHKQQQLLQQQQQRQHLVASP